MGRGGGREGPLGWAVGLRLGDDAGGRVAAGARGFRGMGTAWVTRAEFVGEALGLRVDEWW